MIAGDEAGQLRTPQPFFLQGLVHQMPRLCDSDLIQTAWLLVQPLASQLSEGSVCLRQGSCSPSDTPGWLQLWASGHLMQDSWKQRDGSVLQGNETESFTPICRAHWQTAGIATFYYFSLVASGLETVVFLAVISFKPCQHTPSTAHCLINLWLHSSESHWFFN